MSTPVTRVSITREHEVALRTHSSIRTGRITSTTEHHLETSSPNRLEQQVGLSSIVRVTSRTIGVVVIEETAHTETLIINNTITKVHTVD